MGFGVSNLDWLPAARFLSDFRTNRLQIMGLKNNLQTMPTVALVSRKGGCGKSTLATHIASYLAREGMTITLGDLDHQQSMRVWLKRRPSAAPAIMGWVGETNGNVRPPLGTTHLVLDTPGGMHGLALAKVAMVVDAILIPVSGSVFDREAASDCWAELRLHPRVVSGRCQVAAVGMRLDRRTQAEEIASDWAASVGLNWLCSLRGSQIYVRAVENGLSIFDMPASVTEIDREQWEPLLEWLFARGFARAEPTVVPLHAPGLPPSMPRSPAVLQVLPRAVVNSDFHAVPDPEMMNGGDEVASTGFARFVPRFLRPKSGAAR
jgi:chromosome partitioning protein